MADIAASILARLKNKAMDKDSYLSRWAVMASVSGFGILMCFREALICRLRYTRHTGLSSSSARRVQIPPPKHHLYGKCKPPKRLDNSIKTVVRATS